MKSKDVCVAIACALVWALLPTLPTVARADDFPSRPIRIIVPSAPGGGLDLTTRLVAQRMAEKLGQSVIVDNRAGGETMLGTRLAKDARPDGYTLLAQANGFTTLPAIRINPGYDPIKDFTGIGLMVQSPMVLVIDGSAERPERNLTDLVNRAKREKLTYASSGMGGPNHIAGASFFQSVGADVTQVPYKGNGVALPDVAAGRVHTMFASYISAVPFISGGRMRPIAVTSGERMKPLPNVPTFKESGFNFVYSQWLGLMAPVGTPPAVVNKLSEALNYAIGTKELLARFHAEGSEVVAMEPQAFNDYLQKEVARLAKLASDLKMPKE